MKQWNSMIWDWQKELAGLSEVDQFWNPGSETVLTASTVVSKPSAFCRVPKVIFHDLEEESQTLILFQPLIL